MFNSHCTRKEQLLEVHAGVELPNLNKVVAIVPPSNLVASIAVLAILAFGTWFIFSQRLGMWPLGVALCTVITYQIIVCMYHLFVSNTILWVSGERCYARSRYFPWLIDSIRRDAIVTVETNYQGDHLSTNDIVFSISDTAGDFEVSSLVFWSEGKGRLRVNLLATSTSGAEAVSEIRQWMIKVSVD